MVIDFDGHVTEPEEMWAAYLPSSVADMAPRAVVDNQGRQRTLLAGRLHPYTPPRPNPRPPLEGGWDARARLRDMDAEGIEQALLFTSEGLRFPGIADAAVSSQLCHAYNSWLRDYCQVDSSRLFGAALVPQSDVQLAVLEARRAVTELGFRAVMLRPNPISGRNLDHPYYEPLWSAIEELQVPVGLHEGCTLDYVQSGVDRFDNYTFCHTCSHPHEQQFAMLSLICGGVLERHSRLTVVFLESGAGWLPYWLDRLESNLEDWGYASLPLALKPAEYFQRQCYITAEQRERTLPAVLQLLGDERVMFASDYPHGDCIFPGAVDALRDRADIPDESKRKILGDNAARCLGLPVPIGA
jgi:predicted TIM-barrel fold metal-dependent hydrolase